MPASTPGVAAATLAPTERWAYRYQSNFRSFQKGLGGGVGVQLGYWQGRQAALLARYETDTGWGRGQGLNTWLK